MAEKRKMHPNSLANLQAPFTGNDDARVQKSHMQEACIKRSESIKKTAEEKRRRNKMAEDLLYIMSLPISDAAELVADIKDVKSFEDLGKESDCTVQDAILKALVINAKNGDNKAFEIIRDTVGEKPADIRINVMEEAAEISMQVADALFSDDDETEEDEE